MAGRDETRQPLASVRRSASGDRRPSTGTMTISAIGEVNVALAKIEGRLDKMAELQREQNEDLERIGRELKTGISGVNGRVDSLERATSRGTAQASGAIESLTSSMASFTSQLEASHAQNAEHRAMFMRILEEDRELNRQREEAEQERRREEHAARVAREEAERKALQARSARKEQWLLRAWERLKQPMLLVSMAAAGYLVNWFGNCSGGY